MNENNNRDRTAQERGAGEKDGAHKKAADERKGGSSVSPTSTKQTGQKEITETGHGKMGAAAPGLSVRNPRGREISRENRVAGLRDRVLAESIIQFFVTSHS